MVPFVSVVMPVRNESRFISETIGRLLEQDYPTDKFEIIVVDGMSEDGTREIVTEIAKQYPQISLLANYGCRSSAGRNIGFKSGHGDLFLVVDGHCFIPTDKLLANVAACFEKSGADCLGRPQPLDPPGLTSFQKAVALARGSKLGHGGGSLIFGEYEGFASPVSNGAAYRRDVFEKVGYVDENFDAAEDVEFNYRVEKAGFTCYTSPKLTVRYYPREDFNSLMRQMVRYGKGRFNFIKKHREALTINQLIPVGFVIGLLLFVVLVIWSQVSNLWSLTASTWSLVPILLTVVYGFYIFIIMLESLRIAAKNGWHYLAKLPLIFLQFISGWGGALCYPLAAICGLNMIKIVFIIDTIESPTAGTEKQLLMLIKHLDRARFQPFMCVLRSSEWLEKEFKDCELIDIGFPSFSSLSSYINLLKFSKWMRKKNIDIVQTFFAEGNKVGILAARMAGAKAIISTRRNQGYWHDKREVLMLNILNKSVTCFLANSVNTRQWAAKAEGVDPDRIKVIHNSLEIENFYKGKDEQRLVFREQFVFPSDSIIVGIVANLRPVKAIDVFIRAAKIVTEQCPQARFVIVGDGPLRPELEELCAGLATGSSVRFLGKRLDIPEILSCIDIGVLSSCSESFSNSIVEYMAAGLAVVCTDVGGAKEAVENDVNGYVVEPGDFAGLAEKLIRIISSSSTSAMGDCGRQKAEAMFSRHLIIEQYERLYGEILAS